MLIYNIKTNNKNTKNTKNQQYKSKNMYIKGKGIKEVNNIIYNIIYKEEELKE